MSEVHDLELYERSVHLRAGDREEQCDVLAFCHATVCGEVCVFAFDLSPPSMLLLIGGGRVFDTWSARTFDEASTIEQLYVLLFNDEAIKHNDFISDSVGVLDLAEKYMRDGEIHALWEQKRIKS